MSQARASGLQALQWYIERVHLEGTPGEIVTSVTVFPGAGTKTWESLGVDRHMHENATKTLADDQKLVS